MSFRRRGEIVGGTNRNNSQGGERAPQESVIASTIGSAGFRPTGTSPPRSGVPRGRPVQSRSPISRGLLPERSPRGTNGPEHSLNAHPGIKPSLLTSSPCTSTGSADIDRVLGHQGLPLGTSLLLEEDGTTDFSSTLVKVFLSQGLVHNRLPNLKTKNTHEIVIGMPVEWSRSLPGVYKGSSKEQKLKKLEESQKRISVANVIEQRTEEAVPQLRIAWRYGLQRQQKGLSSDSQVDIPSQYPEYNAQFDITSTLLPAASPQELTSVPLGGTENYIAILRIVRSIVERYSEQLIRIAVPLFLNPMVYTEQKWQDPREVIRFLHGLKAILDKHSSRVTMVITLNLDLYPRSDPLVTIIESSLVDGVLELRPFDSQLHEYLEAVYKNQPSKVKHGHLNIHKIPQLSDLGLMKVSEMELSFKNCKKRFEVEQWSIPVDEEETQEKDPKPSDLEF